MHAQSVAPLPYADADAATLIGIWEESARGLLAAAEEAGPDHWNDPTPCPGWSVGDVVAHVCSIDRFLLGRTDPEHVPDYESPPHVQRGLSRITEIRSTCAARAVATKCSRSSGTPSPPGPRRWWRDRRT